MNIYSLIQCEHNFSVNIYEDIYGFKTKIFALLNNLYNSNNMGQQYTFQVYGKTGSRVCDI